MNLTAKSIYAICAIIELAQIGENIPVKISKISDKYNIPKRFLEIILSELKLSAIVDSKKGAGGGFYLTRKAEDISILDILRITEGDVKVFHYKKYLDENTEMLEPFFNQFNNQIESILKGITIDEALKLIKTRNP